MRAKYYLQCLRSFGTNGFEESEVRTKGKAQPAPGLVQTGGFEHRPSSPSPPVSLDISSIGSFSSTVV